MPARPRVGRQVVTFMKPVRFTVLTAAALAVSLLSGCKDLRKGEYGEAFEWTTEPAWNERTILKHGWARSTPKDTRPIYCYRTLAAADCYDTPQPQFEGRLVGKFETTRN